MKRIWLSFGNTVGIAVSLFFLLSASVWEGTAGVSQALPETGHYAATNSFPVNTVVYITNLETGKTIHLVVSSGLESSGLLALLSRDAADTIGLQGGTMGRIRMGQFTDEMAYSGYGINGLSLYNPDAIVDLDEYGISFSENGRSQRTDDSGLFMDLPDKVNALAVPENVIPQTANTKQPPITEPVKSEPVPVQPSTGATITKLPESSTKLPESSYQVVIPSGSSFSAPMIGNLEYGSYYVQIGAYSKADTAESEIQKIDRQLPTAIMNAGSEEKPLYRVLIGPLNLGESGAILQRYKSIYKDAFVRQGN
jgi:hypothetical protein